MRPVSFLILTALAVAVLASAAAQDAPSPETPPGPLSETLTRGVPAADLLPRTAEAEGAAGRAAALLEARSCKGAAATLDALCAGLIRPEAARSEAVCYARVAELAESCRVEHPR